MSSVLEIVVTSRVLAFTADNIAIPDFNAGAMENWGLITYREGLLYKPGVAGATDDSWIAEVVAHEIAHMVRSHANHD